MSLSDKAAAFARDWYSRPGHACDEPTLGTMLADLLLEVDREARNAENARVARQLADLIGKPGRG